MKLLKDIFGHLVTLAVIAAVAGFVVYSLYFYRDQPSVNCSGSSVTQQVDVAVHVIRQWFGKESQAYTCS